MTMPRSCFGIEPNDKANRRSGDRVAQDQPAFSAVSPPAMVASNWASISSTNSIGASSNLTTILLRNIAYSSIDRMKNLSSPTPVVDRVLSISALISGKISSKSLELNVIMPNLACVEPEPEPKNFNTNRGL